MTSTLAGIVVHLDDILDTRIGTIARNFGDEAAVAVLEAGYHSREDDKFSGVDLTVYQEAYKARDVETLKLSTITGNVTLLAKLVGELTQQAVGRPYHSGAKIYLNVYPYTLTEDEQKGLIELVSSRVNVFSELGIMHPIEIISFSLAQLTPEFCTTNNVQYIFMYHFGAWFEEQTKTLMRTPMPGVTLFSPALYHEKTPSKEEIEECIKEYAHPMLAPVYTSRPWIALELVDVSNFS
jgi:hypothetical protein